MTTTTQVPVVLLKDDYELLSSYCKNKSGFRVNEKQNFSKLTEELHKAVVLRKEHFPPDIVRLNSTAIIKDLETERVLAITVVMPEHADIKNNKVSVLAPIGTALIGFQKGTEVTWEVPSGQKRFTIMEVYNSHAMTAAS
jgi:regulator of nucleoside diphosphate kinase